MKRPGFTLIELLLVLAILSATVFVSLPALSRFNASLALKASAKALVSELRLRQSRARLTHQTQIFQAQNYALPAGLKFIKAPSIRFAASGFPPPGGSGTIVLGNRLGRQTKIIISSSGRVRLE